MDFITLILKIKSMFGTGDIFHELAVTEIVAMTAAAKEGDCDIDYDDNFEWGSDNKGKWVRWAIDGFYGTKFYYR